MPDRDDVPGLSAEAGSPFFYLSERQQQVLSLVALGLTDAEIALELVIATGTVRDHLRIARARLGAVNRCHAVAIAMALGLIQVDVFAAQAVCV